MVLIKKSTATQRRHYTFGPMDTGVAKVDFQLGTDYRKQDVTVTVAGEVMSKVVSVYADTFRAPEIELVNASSTSRAGKYDLRV